MDRSHDFGGEWTERKLDVLEHYLAAYLTALKGMPFAKVYIDAFAGTGYVGGAVEAASGGDDFSGEMTALVEGSARRALRLAPGFDRYIFIEKSGARCKALQDLKKKFPSHADAIAIKQGDCNAILQSLKLDRNTRGVLFLDPYGMQVEWETLRAVAETGVLDTWILFSHSGANRMMPRGGNIPETWRRRLNLVFGTDEWEPRFYREDPQGDLFAPEPVRAKEVTLAELTTFYRERLGRIFPKVSKEVCELKNSRGIPIFSLLFACANPNRKAHKLADKIASHLLKNWSM